MHLTILHQKHGSLSLSITILKKNSFKNIVSKNFKQQPISSIGNLPTKEGGKDDPILSFATKYWCPATYLKYFVLG